MKRPPQVGSVIALAGQWQSWYSATQTWEDFHGTRARYRLGLIQVITVACMALGNDISTPARPLFHLNSSIPGLFQSCPYLRSLPSIFIPCSDMSTQRPRVNRSEPCLLVRYPHAPSSRTSLAVAAALPAAVLSATGRLAEPVTFFGELDGGTLAVRFGENRA